MQSILTTQSSSLRRVLYQKNFISFQFPLHAIIKDEKLKMGQD